MPFRKAMAVAWLATAGFAAVSQQAWSAQPAASNQPASTARVRWPAVQSRVPRDPAVEARIDQMLARMTLEQKVAQVVQPDIASITPEEYRRYSSARCSPAATARPAAARMRRRRTGWRWPTLIGTPR